MSGRESELTVIYRSIILISLGIIGFFLQESIARQEMTNAKKDHVLEQILDQQQHFLTDWLLFKQKEAKIIMSEYVAKDYVVVVANGERVLLRRVYPRITNAHPAKPPLAKNQVELEQAPRLY